MGNTPSRVRISWNVGKMKIELMHDIECWSYSLTVDKIVVFYGNIAPSGEDFEVNKSISLVYIQVALF